MHSGNSFQTALPNMGLLVQIALPNMWLLVQIALPSMWLLVQIAIPNMWLLVQIDFRFLILILTGNSNGRFNKIFQKPNLVFTSILMVLLHGPSVSRICNFKIETDSWSMQHPTSVLNVYGSPFLNSTSCFFFRIYSFFFKICKLFLAWEVAFEPC